MNVEESTELTFAIGLWRGQQSRRNLFKSMNL